MKRRLPLLALVVLLAVSACQPAPARQTLAPTQPGGYPAPVTNPVNPDPAAGYPAPASPQEQTVNELWMAYPPMPEDATLERSTFLVEAAALMPSSQTPGGFDLSLEGSLPNGCHQPRVVVNAPDAQNVIQVDAYTMVQPGLVCAEVIVPFAGTVATITGFPAGTYKVLVNGEIDAGQVTLP